MLSITRFLHAPTDELSTARNRALSLLIEAIALHSIDVPGVDSGVFQREIRTLGSQIEQTSDAEECLMLTGQIIQSTRAYHRAAETQVAAHVKEMQGIVDLLTQTLLQVSNSSHQTAEALRDIEKRIERARELEDVKALRAELKQLVTRIQDDARLHELKFQEIQGDVSAAITQARKVPEYSLQHVQDLDSVTGLPSALQAERVIRNLTPASPRLFPVMFFLERLDLINTRYGFKAGDDVLLLFGQHLAQNLRPGDQLYRWRGPSFIALLDRGSQSEVQVELKRLASSKLEHLVDVNGRRVLMTLSATTGLMPASGEVSPGELLRKIDAFVAERSSRSVPAPAHPIAASASGTH